MSQPTASRFPTTDWSMVARTDGGSEGERRRALAALVERYLPALRSYLRSKWKLSADRADDLLQSFMMRKVLEQDLIPRACRTKGRFRTFLMTALDRFVISEYRHRTAAKRLPREELSLSALEEHAESDPAAPSAADVFDVAWGRQVLDLSLGRMRRECDARERHQVWAIFDARVLKPTLEAAEPVPLTELVRQLGLASPERASNLLITAKRMFARHLREVVGEYLGDDEDRAGEEVEAEIRRLMSVLSSARA